MMDIQRAGGPGEPPHNLEAFVKGTMSKMLPCLLCEVLCSGRGATQIKIYGERLDWYVHALCHQCQNYKDTPQRSKELLYLAEVERAEIQDGIWPFAAKRAHKWYRRWLG